jgi:exportin-1
LQPLIVGFQNHPQAWTRVDGILDRSTNAETRMLAANILKNTVQTRWKILPPEQRAGIKTYVVNLIIKLSSDSAVLAANKSFLTRLNMVLIQIVKQEWPDQWPNFIPELVNSSKTSQSLCANNMNILMLLSEEVFDFNSGQMTQEKMKTMKKNLNREFTLIFQLCEYILEHSTDAALLTETLRTLLRFLHWIPIGYIFETKLIETLAIKFFPVARFQNDTLAALSEIGSLKLREDGPGGVTSGPLAGSSPQVEAKYNQCFINLFLAVMTQVCKLITPDTDIPAIYASGAEAAETFIRYLAIFITGFLKVHISLVENESDATRAALGQAISILLRISRVDDTDVFKITLDFWNTLVTDLYNTQRTFMAQHGNRMLTPGSGLLTVGVQPAFTPNTGLNSGLASQSNHPRLAMYLKSLAELRLVMIGKMAKPEEVLIVEDENGEIVRAHTKDTDAITLYKSMREVNILHTRTHTYTYI